MITTMDIIKSITTNETIQLLAALVTGLFGALGVGKLFPDLVLRLLTRNSEEAAAKRAARQEAVKAEAQAVIDRERRLDEREQGMHEFEVRIREGLGRDIDRLTKRIEDMDGAIANCHAERSDLLDKLAEQERHCADEIRQLYQWMAEVLRPLGIRPLPWARAQDPPVPPDAALAASPASGLPEP